ncbi:MAG: prephenate dehydratase [Bacteroides sp.]|nr:prephenate dehydratase [Bacteroides sp.]
MEKIAIQGIKGSFHEEAAMLFYGREFSPLECMDFRGLVNQVATGRASFGVMAVENSLAGGLLPNFSLIRNASLQVLGEVYLRISQHLMGLPGQNPGDLREVRSHPMALSQTEDFFLKYPGIRLVESYDTALSAREISEKGLWGTGAVGSKQAAGIYGLSILASSIETNKENFTRFLVVGTKAAPLEKNLPVKASLAFIAPNVPGGLVKVLNPLANAGVNLSMLQSLPLIGSTWEYIFHADMLFIDSDHAHKTISDLEKKLQKLWVLGLYHPGARPPASNGVSNLSKEMNHVHTGR